MGEKFFSLQAILAEADAVIAITKPLVLRQINRFVSFDTEISYPLASSKIAVESPRTKCLNAAGRLRVFGGAK